MTNGTVLLTWSIHCCRNLIPAFASNSLLKSKIRGASGPLKCIFIVLPFTKVFTTLNGDIVVTILPLLFFICSLVLSIFDIDTKFIILYDAIFLCCYI